jgi:ketopantoate reductase
MTTPVTMPIVGAGRVGRALHELAPVELPLIDRVQGWALLDAPAGAPVLVCVRNDDLAPLLARVPAARHADLVFVQNGLLRPWLRAQGLADATRGLLFFAVARRGDAIQPGAPSPFHGPHAAHVVATLQRLGVPAQEVDAASFAAIELEKLLWNCCFGLCCAALHCSVGEVVDRHADTLHELVAELLPIGERLVGTSLALAPLVARLCDYSRSIPTFVAGLREWPWRNGPFVDAAAREQLALPVHARLLALAGWPTTART